MADLCAHGCRDQRSPCALAALDNSAPKLLYIVQLKEEEERIEEGEADTRKKLKAMRDHNKEWERHSRDQGVQTQAFCLEASVSHSCRIYPNSIMRACDSLHKSAGWHMARLCKQEERQAEGMRCLLLSCPVLLPALS